MCSIRGVPSPRPDAPPTRAYLILLGAALLVRITTALLIPEPGYMDTAYYTVMGQPRRSGRTARIPETILAAGLPTRCACPMPSRLAT